MALSDVSICNQGLGWIGGNVIISLNDDSNEAKLCKANYEILRDSLLEAADWTFAMARFVPSALVTPPVWGYLYQFQIPSTILRTIYVGRSARPEEDDPVEEWIKEGQLILTNQAVIYCRGVARVTDPSQFTFLFGQALAARLAMDLAVPLANSRSLQADMTKLFAGKMQEAITQDNRQGKTRVLRAPGMQRARRAGSASFLGPTV